MSLGLRTPPTLIPESSCYKVMDLGSPLTRICGCAVPSSPIGDGRNHDRVQTVIIVRQTCDQRIAARQVADHLAPVSWARCARFCLPVLAFPQTRGTVAIHHTERTHAIH